MLKKILVELFSKSNLPYRPENNPIAEDTNSSLPPLVTEEELSRTIKRMRAQKAAPGPDGIPGKILTIANNYIPDRIINLLNACLLRKEDSLKYGNAPAWY